MRRLSALAGFRVGLVVILALASSASFFPGTAAATAANMTMTMVRLTNMSANSQTTGTVCINPTTSVATQTIVVTFPSQFNLSTTLSNWATTNTPPSSPGTGSNYWPATATGWPSSLGNAAAVDNTAKTVTWNYTSTTLAPGTIYCFDWTNAAAFTSGTGTGAAGLDLQGTVATENASAVVIDQGSWATTIVSNNQIVVTAVVPPIFELTMPANADTLGTLALGSVSTSGGVTPTVKTNAHGGWVMWVYDQYQALHSPTTSGNIGSVPWNTDAPSTLTAGTAGYALNVSLAAVGGAGDCTDAVAPEYNVAAHGGSSGGELYSSFTEIGDCPGVSNGDGLKIQEEAAISVLVPAATDYTDTIYVAAAGLF